MGLADARVPEYEPKVGYRITAGRINKDYSLRMVSHLASRVWREQGTTYSPAAWPPENASNHLRFDDPLSQEAHLGSASIRLLSRSKLTEQGHSAS